MDGENTLSPGRGRPQRHWHAGYNPAGYLPEAEPGTYGSFAEARDALAEDMDYHADNEASWDVEHDCDDVPCPAFGDACHLVRAADIVNERHEFEAAGGPEWSGFANDTEYWVHLCSEGACPPESA